MSPSRGSVSPRGEADEALLGHADPSMAAVIEELVLANHVLFRKGVVDAYGHVSVRHPTVSNRFLISCSKAPGLVAAEDILELDLDGRDVRATGKPRYLECSIHAEIYRARGDVMSVVHSHSPSIVPFTVVKGVTLRPIFHMAAFLQAGPPVFEIREFAGEATDLLVRTPQIGRALAQVLGSKTVVLMRGHGSTAIGRTLREAVFHAYYTEVNARLLSDALALGSPTFLTDEEAAACAASVATAANRAWELWRDELRPRGSV